MGGQDSRMEEYRRWVWGKRFSIQEGPIATLSTMTGLGVQEGPRPLISVHFSSHVGLQLLLHPEVEFASTDLGKVFLKKSNHPWVGTKCGKY